jgi:hypothetical protein
MNNEDLRARFEGKSNERLRKLREKRRRHAKLTEWRSDAYRAQGDVLAINAELKRRRDNAKA